MNRLLPPGGGLAMGIIAGWSSRVRQSAQNARQPPDTVEGQAKRRQPLFEILVHAAGEAFDRFLHQVETQAIRGFEYPRRVLERRERRVAPNVVHDALDIQRAGADAGAVVIQGK